MIKFDESIEFLLDSKPYHNTITCAKVLFSGKYGNRKLLAALVKLKLIDENYFPQKRLLSKGLVRYRKKIALKTRIKTTPKYILHFKKAGVQYFLSVFSKDKRFPALLKCKCSDLINPKKKLKSLKKKTSQSEKLVNKKSKNGKQQCK